MDDVRLPRRDPGPGFGFLFYEDDASGALRKTIGNKEADYPGTDDGDVRFLGTLGRELYPLGLATQGVYTTSSRGG